MGGSRRLSFVLASLMLASLVAGAPDAAAAELRFTAVADAYVRADQPKKRFGRSTELRAGKSPISRSYLRFDLSSITGPVERATLNLFSLNSSPASIQVHGVSNDSWKERTITYANAPAFGPAVGTSGSVASGTWVEVDVTPLVAADGPRSVAVTSSASPALRFASRERASATPPTLVVQLAPPPPPPVPETSIASAPSSVTRSGVAAFTLESTDPAATFECALDAGEFLPCSSSPVFHVANGRHRLSARATSAAGTDATPVTASWWADALLQNGNLETPPTGWARNGYVVAGWKGYRATLSVAAGGMAGDAVLRVADNGTGDNYSAYASPYSVTKTVAGTTYTATGHVRSDTGHSVCMRVREFSAGAEVGGREACVTATTSWQAFPPVSYAPARSGNELYVYFYQWKPPPDASFEIDGAALDDGTPDVSTLPSSADPVLLATADVAACYSSGDEAVARLLDSMPGTIALAGDTVYRKGLPEEYAGCYDPAWGRHLARTRPAVGNHEYAIPGATGYFDYYGSAAGAPGKGWYAYDLGRWRIIALNSNCDQVGCGPGSEQYEWLRSELEATNAPCTAAYFHHPLFNSGSVHQHQEWVRPFWDLLYEHGADVVVSGHEHNYQRYAPQTPAGAPDASRGIRQFIVGTGGAQLYPLGTPEANLEAATDTTFGVLKLSLRDEGYDWEFVPQAGSTYRDAGTDSCHA